MGIFKRLKEKNSTSTQTASSFSGIASGATQNQAALAEMVLNALTEGVIITDAIGTIQMINPAAIMLCGCGEAAMALGVNVNSIMRFENGEGAPIEDNANVVAQAIQGGTNLQTRDYILLTQSGTKHPIAITAIPVGQQRIVTFRDITKELEEEGAQTEFISTASHEMRTPVASIEGYLGLALNPQTATIDERARKYLTEAHESSRHLGRLFQDLLDVTKLDDKRIHVNLTPIDVRELVSNVADGQVPAIQAKGLQYAFGAVGKDKLGVSPDHAVGQSAYALIDADFLREIVNNLVENAIKYTNTGGSIWVNVRGDGDQVLINVTDTGIGISPEDLKHVFQKFYRADNSQTRAIGGTGLGLYLVKSRVEAMGGKVWAESSFGEGTTFYVSFPRLTAVEYERRKQVLANQAAMAISQNGAMQQAAFKPASASLQVAPTNVAPNGAVAPANVASNGIVAAGPAPTGVAPVGLTPTDTSTGVVVNDIRQ